MGSGTTGKMAKQANRNFIGIELDEGYFQMAKDRIESVQVADDMIDAGII
jgi:site-specific DNA-methyltransferase (adenine-specific)